MSTTLRQVLQHFEQNQVTLSLSQLARTLGVEQTTLQIMIDHWVRKGKLREVTAPSCTTCGSASGCPFIVALPRCYELASGGETISAPPPAACTCGSCH